MDSCHAWRGSRCKVMTVRVCMWLWGHARGTADARLDVNVVENARNWVSRPRIVLHLCNVGFPARLPSHGPVPSVRGVRDLAFCTKARGAGPVTRRRRSCSGLALHLLSYLLIYTSYTRLYLFRSKHSNLRCHVSVSVERCGRGSRPRSPSVGTLRGPGPLLLLGVLAEKQ